MSYSGPILIVEDDPDDHFITIEALKELEIANPVLFFENGPQLIHYLGSTSEQPFLILCDVNLPIMNGIEIRNFIQSSPELKQKAMPFIFFTTSGSPELVLAAYKGSVQGYFKKPHNFEDIKFRLASIVDYWRSCLRPNTLK